MREPSLQYGEATIFGYVLRKPEILLGMAVEVEWAMGKAGVNVLQILPPQTVDLWPRHSKFSIRPTDIDAECSGVISHRALLARRAFPRSSACLSTASPV